MLVFPLFDTTPPFCEGGACSCEYRHSPGKKTEVFLDKFLEDSLELVWNRMGCPGLQKEKASDEKEKGKEQHTGEEFLKKLFEESMDLVRNQMGDPGLQKEKVNDEKEKGKEQQNGEEFLKKLFEESLDLVRNRMDGARFQENEEAKDDNEKKGKEQQNGGEFLKKLFEESLDLVRNRMGGPGFQENEEAKDDNEKKCKEQQNGGEFLKKLFEESLDLVWNQMGRSGYQESEEPKDENEKKGKEQENGGEFLKKLFEESLDLVWNQMGRSGLQKKAKKPEDGTADKKQELLLKKDVFCIPVETTGYEPGEITVTVKNRTLKIHGKHEEKSTGSFVSREFRREFPIPAEVDPNTIVAQIEEEGILSIRAVPEVKELPEKELESLPEPTEQKENADSSEIVKVEDALLVKTEIATLETEGFKPDEITVKVREGKVLVHAKHEEKESESFVLREMRREFPIPSEVDPETIVADMSGNGHLRITGSSDIPQEKKDEGQIQVATEDYVVVSDEGVTEQTNQREVAVRIQIPAKEVSGETSS